MLVKSPKLNESVLIRGKKKDKKRHSEGHVKMEIISVKHP